jgi:hypothetical protein
VGGPATAPAGWVDMHCQDSSGAAVVQPVGTCDVIGTVPSTCQPPPAASAGADGGDADGAAGADAGAAADAGGDDAGTGLVAFGPPLYGSGGVDDDCKYHVAWTSTPIRRNSDVTFTVTPTRLFDPATPVSCADLVPDVTLDTHLAPNTHPTATESSSTPRSYTLGPIRFDQAGRWTVRFHFYEYCGDATEDSPHGHIAFFVDVP